MRVSTTNWQPPTYLEVRDRESLKTFERQLTHGEGAYPAGSLGNGLYPNERTPILKRAAEAIRKGREAGIDGDVVQLIYLPKAAHYQPLITEINRGRSEPLRAVDLGGGASDNVLAFFSK
ncbi:MAG: hypothetical protein DCC75_09465 [Proteobacteria bacterium]|nr:MAG: hypothetical protein DCC75_09465 [Pseudomonadota bacterium]